MKKKQLILILYMLFSNAHAQKSAVTDTLLQELALAKDTQKVQVMLALSNQYAFTDISKSIDFSNEALKEAKILNYKKGIANALGKLAETYSRTNREDKALDLMLELLKLEQKRGYHSGEALAKLSIGNIYNRLGAYPKALEFFFQSLRIYEKIKDIEKTAIVLWNIGNVYDLQKDSTALYYYLQSAKVLEQKEAKNYNDKAMIFTSIGSYYKDHGEPDSALIYFQKSLSNAKEISGEYNTHAITLALLNIGSVYETKSDYKQALAYNQKAFDIADKTNNKMLLGLSYQNRARIYKTFSDYNSSTTFYLKAGKIFESLGIKDHLVTIQNKVAENYIAAKKFDSATYYATAALEAADSNDLPNLAKDALANLIKINKQMGRYEAALKFQEQFQMVNDTLLNREKVKQLTALRVVYETEKKQEQIRILLMNQLKESSLRYLLFIGIIVIMIIGGLLYHQQRMKNRKDRVIHSSQEQLLQARLKNTQLHEQQLQKEIDDKNKELTANALNFIQKNQLMEELIEKIITIRRDANGTVSQRLNRLQQTIRHSFDLDKNWDDFRLCFEQVHDQFFKELSVRFPELTNKDLRLCALLKLNLSSKEIASLTGISPSSVKMARYRLRKRLGLESENDLVTFLITLEKSLSLS